MKYITIAILALVVLGVLFWLRAYRRARQRQKENEAAIASAGAYAADFTTPEGAILCLEDAYRRRDLDGAVACKDFAIEAKLMLETIGGGFDRDGDIIAKTAETLELSFRMHTIKAWPDFTRLQSFFVAREAYKNGVVVVTEICRFPDGRTSRQKILVAQTPRGWRVLNPLP